MTLASDLFGTKVLISRQWLREPLVDSGGAEVAYSITSPAKATVGRVSALGAGGWFSRSFPAGGPPGGGAAFARTKFSTTPGEGFTAFVGNPYQNVVSVSTWAVNGDGSSRFIRNAGSVVLCKAAPAIGINSGGAYGRRGLASDCIGDVKRDGENTDGASLGGAPGDQADQQGIGLTFPQGGKNSLIPVGHGVGGVGRWRVLGGSETFEWEIVPGCGLICIEWFTQDPGY